MYIKRSLLLAGVLFVTASSLSTTSIAQENPNYHKSRTRPVIPFRHLTLAAPPGMVYIPGGSVTSIANLLQILTVKNALVLAHFI